MSRILNRQRQLAEQGRLRLGYTTEATTKQGKTINRPVASATWIITSHSQDHVEAAAALWGGQVEHWQPMGNGAQQWRVITQAHTIDAILPPGEPLMQAYELWSKGGCQRRCDGVTEQFTGAPCICLNQFGDTWHEQAKGTVCDTKSRLKVILPDMPGMGAWRVETGSYYAADEMAGMIDVIRGTVGDQALIPVRLRIEPRTRIAGGVTKQFVVPVLELHGVTAGELLGGTFAGIASVESARQQRAIGTGNSDTPDYVAAAKEAGDLEAVRQIWHLAEKAGHLTDELKRELTAIGQSFNPAESPVSDDPEQLWFQIMQLAGERGMTETELNEDFTKISGGVKPEDAGPAEMVKYLEHLRSVKA